MWYCLELFTYVSHSVFKAILRGQFWYSLYFRGDVFETQKGQALPKVTQLVSEKLWMQVPRKLIIRAAFSIYFGKATPSYEFKLLRISLRVPTSIL